MISIGFITAICFPILVGLVGFLIGRASGKRVIINRYGLDNYTEKLKEELSKSVPESLEYVIKVQFPSKETVRNIEEYSKGWIGAKVECDVCRSQWVAVYHESCDQLECNTCDKLVNFEIVELQK